MTGGMTATLGMLAPSSAVLAQMLTCVGVGGSLGAGIASRIVITDLPQMVPASSLPCLPFLHSLAPSRWPCSTPSWARRRC